MLRLTYVGHATILVELDGQRILTDPLVTPWLGPLRRQVRPVDPGDLGSHDVILLSHLHHDHLHRPSLSRLERGSRLIVPEGAGGLVRRWGYSGIEEVRAGDRLQVGDVEIEAIRAIHGGKRHFSSMLAEPLGYMLRGSQSVYFAGDTDIFDAMGDLAGVDVALIPIWGWGPNLGEGHLDPGRAAEVVGLLRPRIVVPIHWGTYFPVGLPWRRRWAMRQVVEQFHDAVQNLAPDVEILVLQPGMATEVGS